MFQYDVTGYSPFFNFFVVFIFCSLSINFLWWFSDVLVELFLHQFCDAHTCSGKHKPFSRGGKVRPDCLAGEIYYQYAFHLNYAIANFSNTGICILSLIDDLCCEVLGLVACVIQIVNTKKPYWHYLNGWLLACLNHHLSSNTVTVPFFFYQEGFQIFSSLSLQFIML